MKRLLFALPLILFGCSDSDEEATIKGTQLKSQTVYFETQTGEFRPAERIDYYYNLDGKLVKEEESVYDIQLKTYDLFYTAIYSYDQGKLKSINKKLTDYPKTTITTYEYSGDNVSKIHNDDEVDTDVTITHLPDNKVEAFYNHSNGRSFTYRFTLTNDNMSFEQTVGDDGLLDSETLHEYDNKKNPLLLLGYVDYLFVNTSANNRTKTTSKFFSEQKPQTVPVSYVYTFNDLNYPTEVIRTYESTGSGRSALMKIEYEYN